MLENRPEILEAFQRATVKGIEYSLNHKDEALSILYRYNPALDPEISELQYDAWAANVRQATRLLYFDPDVVKETVDLGRQIFSWLVAV